MKTLLCLLALAVTARCEVDTSEIEEHLPHFDLTQLTDEFKNFETLPETCAETSKKCALGGHEHARTCISMFFDEKGDEIRECVDENEDLQQASQDWQEASLQWHVNIQKCLAGEEAPAGESENDVYFLFKRDATEYNCDAEEDAHEAEDYENGKACFEAFKSHKAKCSHCIKIDTGCSDYVSCTGRGPRPEDERLAGWWAKQSKLGREKKNKIKKAKKMIFTCLGLGGGDGEGKRRRRFRMRRLRRF